jgi:hypothetical protein
MSFEWGAATRLPLLLREEVGHGLDLRIGVPLGRMTVAVLFAPTEIHQRGQIGFDGRPAPAFLPGLSVAAAQLAAHIRPLLHGLRCTSGAARRARVQLPYPQLSFIFVLLLS